MPESARMNRVLHPNYYNFTIFLSSDMIRSKENSPEEGDFHIFFGTAVLFILQSVRLVTVCSQILIHFLSQFATIEQFIILGDLCLKIVLRIFRIKKLTKPQHT